MTTEGAVKECDLRDPAPKKYEPISRALSQITGTVPTFPGAQSHRREETVLMSTPIPDRKVEVAPFQVTAALCTTTVLIGALVDGKPNYMTIAWCSPATHSPPSFMFACNKTHHTNKGIFANRNFSVNIPCVDQVQLLDYCGVHSGTEVDKAHLGHSFFGITRTAPMLARCPVCFECTLTHQLDLGVHFVIVGKVEKVWANEDIVERGPQGEAIDVTRLNPILFSFCGPSYRSLGPAHGTAWKTAGDYDPARDPAALATISPAPTPGAIPHPHPAPPKAPVDYPHVDLEKCLGCGNCVQGCPMSLFAQGGDGKAIFDTGRIPDCTHCHHCKEGCPVEAITFSV
ncbi:flavin reductase [Paratrimastix pyriformis]|uniref:Flavin reductase n=1 Tax=Paratrimastix pyriformis TaxID=342808 RepID=A0ABQ8UP58_9EUKA|nr:flavin reductase [Paratrimastix pyriformis]